MLRTAIPDLIAATDRLPGSLVRAGRAALSADDPTGWAHDAAAAITKAATLGDTHALTLRTLTAIGPSSASDADLQDRVGVTRGRLAQVLGDLADADLVTASRDGLRLLYQPHHHGSPTWTSTT